MNDATLVRTVVVLTALFLGFVFLAAALDFRAESKCQRLGWPGHSVTITLTAYCIARTNQTDVIVPLDSAAKLGKRVTP